MPVFYLVYGTIISFGKRKVKALIPHIVNIYKKPVYLQQGTMESNGKRVGRDGKINDYQTELLLGELNQCSACFFFSINGSCIK
jgi:glucose-6-phosphate isomerase